MANKVKFNLKGFRALRTSPAMDALVLDAAKKVAAKAGPGFVAESSPGKNRARATVTPDTAEAAMLTGREPQVLLGAMDAARD